MAIGWTKKQVAAMVETLDEEYLDIEGAAKAALDTAMELVAERAKFAVIGQVYHSNEHGPIKPGHEDAVKVMLDLYDTETKANDAARDWSASTSNGDRLQTWVIATHFGTPSSWHTERRNAYKALLSKADEKRREKFLKSIEDQTRKMTERAEQMHAMEAAAGGQQWPCSTVNLKERPCRHTPTCK